MAPSSSSQAAEILAQLVADPGNLGLRAVYADALQAAGDPRGEFIALQLGDDPVAHARAEQLLAVHYDAWVPPIPEIVPGTVRFERGFAVALRTLVGSEILAESLERWEWAFVEQLSVNYADLATLVTRTPLLWLVCAQRHPALSRWARAGVFPTIRVLGATAWAPEDRSAFPNLAVLARWVPDDITVQYRKARAMGLQALAFLGIASSELPALFATRDDGPPELRVSVASSEQAFFDGNGWRMRVWRDEPRAALQFVAGPGADAGEFPAIFDALRRAGIRDIDVRIAPNMRAFFDARSRGIAVRTEGPGVDLSAVDRT